MSTTTNSFQLKQLDSRIKSVWQRSQMLHVISGILAFCRWGVPLFLLAVFVDWMTYMPASGRVAFLITLLAVSFYKAWRCGWRHLRAFDATHTALLLEKQHGGLESLLVSAVQLRDPETDGGTSDAMRDKTCRMAEEAASTLKPDQAVPFQKLRHPAVIALVLGLLMGVFAVVNGPFLAAGLTRIFAPWMAVVYPTKTHLDLGKGDLVVKEGDSAQIVIGVSGVVPDKATLYLRTGEGSPRELELEIVGDRCEYTLASASRDFSYRIKAGDARSDWHQVRVISAPRIEKVQVGLEFPSYLERAAETVEALTLTVPEGTKIHWQLTLDRPISEANLQRDGEEPTPLQVTNDGRQLIIDEMTEASRGYSFSWVEKEYGFDFTSPRYYLQVASDQPPRVELTSPDTNLNALLGRRMDLAVRAHDDHDIGATSITYRVNLRPEKTVSLPTPVRIGDGEQGLNWDYRKDLPNLKIGDTVSFVIEVADKYPGADGPHKARSETRRITFLSREEYLAQIERKKDRLLSRVRSTYRQERAAHELVRKLNPQDTNFLQTCQLEAIRQEMLREQLKDIAREVQGLLDDLEANNVTDAVEGDALVRVHTGLVSIAEKHVAKAASLLRDQTGTVANRNLNPNLAIQAVNQAARELAGLVLQRGIDSAREVFARESHMLAQEQATLRLLAMQTKENDKTALLSARQKELATWTDQLIVSLRKGMRYDRRPIAVLGLTRRIKELRASGAEDKMRRTAKLIQEGKAKETAALHTEIIAPLLAAEFSMRTGAEYAAIIEFNDLLDSLHKAQQKLRTECDAMSARDFEKRHAELAASQAEIQSMFIPSLLPPVSAHRARLFDKTLPDMPPVEGLRTAAENSIAEALGRLETGEQNSAIEFQLEAEKQLAALAKLLDRSAVELSLRTQGLSSLVSTAVERTTQIEDYETRQIALLEQTEETALDEKNSNPLVEPQQFLAEEIAEFRNELRKDEADKDVLPLVSQLGEVAGVLEKATGALKDNRPEDALEYQEEAADLIAKARELATAQAERLTLLQDLHTFQRAVGIANGWMLDIVAEQNDLVAETKSGKPEGCAALIPVMKNLRQCFTDVAPVLDLVAGRLDAGTPLLFANTDMEDAIAAIEAEDLVEAIDAQQVTAESLAEVQTLVKAVQIQTSYLAEIVEFLHSTQADAALMAFRQKQLKQKMAAAVGDPAPLLAEQAALQAEAETYARQLDRATGVKTYSKSGAEMGKAHEMMKAGNAADAIAQMELAEATLVSNAEDLYLVITMLHGLPSIEVTSASPEELVLLIDVLAIAADQRNLSRRTEAAQASVLAELAEEQQKLKDNSAKIFGTATPHPKLATAHQHFTLASKALLSSDRSAIRQNQVAADDALRHFIIEQALILETAKGAPSSSDEPVLTEAETDDLYESTANFVSDFVSGESPKDKRTEWEVLGNRNRAALNQNFARELPLEYRGTLKNYYERVAK